MVEDGPGDSLRLQTAIVRGSRVRERDKQKLKVRKLCLRRRPGSGEEEAPSGSFTCPTWGCFPVWPRRRHVESP